MESGPERSLLDRRLVIVTGKGGTGKTTVASALALGASRAGRRVLLAEVGSDEQIPALFERRAEPVGYAGREILPGLTAMRIEPFAALAEYLGLQLRVPAIVDAVLRNTAFQQLMSAAPGWRELITLGKIWHLAQLGDVSGARRYDLIVVDAPATGHGISFLDTPRVIVSAVRAGPLHEHTVRVEQMLEDPEHTVVLPVALAEELPARETAELIDRVRELRIAVDRVIVNSLASVPLLEALPAEQRAQLAPSLEALDPGVRLGALPSAKSMAACVRYWSTRHELGVHYTDEISRSTGLPVTRLPRLQTGVSGPDELAILSEALLGGPAADPGVTP